MDRVLYLLKGRDEQGWAVSKRNMGDVLTSDFQ